MLYYDDVDSMMMYKWREQKLLKILIFVGKLYEKLLILQLHKIKSNWPWLWTAWLNMKAQLDSVGKNDCRLIIKYRL